MLGSDLAAAVRLFSKVVEHRATIPILSHVRMQASKGRLTIFGTDLDTELTIDLPIAGASFDVAVDQKALLAAAEHIGDAEVQLLAEGGSKFVVSGADTFKLPTLSADECPCFSPWKPRMTFRLDSADLVDALEAVMPGMSEEETRYYLNGVNLQRIDDKIGFTTTDGHRLHMLRLAAPEGLGELPQAILPKKAVRLLRTLAGRECDAVEISIGDKALFRVGDAILTTKLIDGSYPAYERVVPKSFGGHAEVPAGDLLRFAHAAQGLSGSRIKIMRLWPRELRAMCKDDSGVEVSSAFAGEVEGAPPELIGMNPQYLTAILRGREGMSARLRFGDAASPILIDFPSDATFSAVQMPMRVH